MQIYLKTITGQISTLNVDDVYEIYANYIYSFINTDINKWNFKSHQYYTYMLEDLSYEIGLQYLNCIIDKFSDFYNNNKNYLIDLCHKNDLIGFPNKYDYNNFTSCSPTNLRYILHALIILTYMKDECNLNIIDIIEIGGGYGGLCFFINNLSSLFNITINSYTLFDLEYPKLLQKKYLENLNITNLNFEDINNIKNLKTNSFLISNYAFSEIKVEYRKEYSKKVLNPYTSYGFITWNHNPYLNKNATEYNFNDEKFIDNKSIKIINAYPENENYYVFYK